MTRAFLWLFKALLWFVAISVAWVLLYAVVPPPTTPTMLFDSNGAQHRRPSTALVQEGDSIPDGAYCEWMPFQQGQAKAASKGKA